MSGVSFRMPFETIRFCGSVESKALRTQCCSTIKGFRRKRQLIGAKPKRSYKRELGVSEVMIDERKGREIAVSHSLNVRGVLGLLTTLKRSGFIPEVRPLIQKLIQDLDFRIAEKLVADELARIGESW